MEYHPGTVEIQYGSLVRIAWRTQRRFVTEEKREKMRFKDQLESGKFVVITELQPPKGTDVSGVLHAAELLKSRVAAFNVPDLQNAIMRLGSLSTCAFLKTKGMEVIFNLSCLHRNRLVLQSELLNASVLGLKNILLLEGDPPSGGDHFEAQPVSDLGLMGLLGAAKRLQEGYDLAGNELLGKPKFCVGAMINAAAKGSDLDLEIENIEKKIQWGADFFLTHSIYDVKLFENFIKKIAAHKVPVIATVTLLKSAGMARYFNTHVKGAAIPDAIIEKLMKASDKREASAEISGDLIRQLKPLSQGIQIVPIGWENLVPKLLDDVGL